MNTSLQNVTGEMVDLPAKVCSRAIERYYRMQKMDHGIYENKNATSNDGQAIKEATAMLVDLVEVLPMKRYNPYNQ